MCALVCGPVACGGEADERPPPGIVAAHVTDRSGPEESGDSRFASEVPTTPPPKPTRQIDRTEEKKPTDVRQVDKTLETAARDDSALLFRSPEGPAEGSLGYTAHVTMAVNQVAVALDGIEATGRDMGGYLASRNDTSIDIRVPRVRFDEALKKVEASGDVVHHEVAAQDIADVSMDVEARLKNAHAVRDRLHALLEKADMKETIEIERELERVTSEIEMLAGKLRLLHEREAFSTISVSLEPRGTATLSRAAVKLPFPWLSELGLPSLLNFGAP